MPHYPKLIGDKCFLSPVSTEDAEKWAAWLNDLDVAIPLGDEAYTLTTLENEQESIAEIIKKQWKVFSICDRETNQAIGRIMLFSINQVDRSAMAGILIGEKSYWGKGYGQDAMRLILDYGFNLLNLNSIMLGVFAFNERAIQAYKRVGFKEIGRRRQARIIAGKMYDVILMDILAEEFMSPFVSRLMDE